MHLVYVSLFFLACLRWGDWKNWEKYYSTILFFIMVDLLHNFLTYNHSLWLFHDNILPNHTIISLLIMSIQYPATILIYLGSFFNTRSWKKRMAYFIFWVMLYIVKENVNVYLGFISHHNGWQQWHSVLFVFAMFIIFPVHYKKPLLAWLISLGVLILIWAHFDFPLYLK